MNTLKVNDVIELEANDLSYECLGICFYNGLKIFVSGLFKGEKGKVRIFKLNKNIAFGYLEELIIKSKFRIFIPDKNSIISNAQPLLGIDYNEQYNFKKNLLETRLKWSLKFNDFVFNGLEKSHFETTTRNKIVVPLIVKNNLISLAMHAYKSNDLVDVKYISLASKNINDFLNKSIIFLNQNKITYISKIMVRENKYNELQVIFYNSKESNNINKNTFIEFIKNNKNIRQFWIVNEDGKLINLHNQDFHLELGGMSFKVDCNSFFQTNCDEFSYLINDAKKLIKNNEFKEIIELYCGVGSLGMLLSNKEQKLIGIEISESSIKNANQNKEINNLKNTTYYQGDAFDIIKKVNVNLKNNLIILDPPRAGLDKKLINFLAQNEAENVLYISCDLGTMIRDIKLFNELGYELLFIKGYDVFRNTSHIEMLSLIHKIKK
ncbi:class I SAM-dependent RNA methyltransferase [Mycoplasma crocodyli]|uniref:Hypothetical RNA methyltransferase n=1 Tax=Mycoplasma crocodyli (strain ATCC 51981 / MP145) TaxID=512564 RepID=D5E652_MYCCM|nr:methyltransferase domain-containing protein [Mycoplasma crocodyli]ADE19826.1 hypothetical RNA methyltransferase [Mycoplasma crocodyli MP145]